MNSRAELGRNAERIVAEHLTQLGFEVLGRNIRFGRLEIDIIARRRDLLVFCEVRARQHDRFVAPAATVDARKIANLRSAAYHWLRAHRPGEVDIRFDVAAVVFDRPDPRVIYYEGAF